MPNPPVKSPKPRGEHQATSILQVVLQIARIVSWILLIVTGIVIFASIVGNLFGGIEIDGEHIEIDTSDTSVTKIVDELRVFLSAGLLVHISGYLLNILKTIKAGTPFEAENADRLRMIGRAVVVIELAKLGIGLVGAMFLAIEPRSDYELGLDLMPFLAAAIAYTLAKVFEEGARLKEEQDYTI